MRRMMWIITTIDAVRIAMNSVIRAAMMKIIELLFRKSNRKIVNILGKNQINVIYLGYMISVYIAMNRITQIM